MSRYIRYITITLKCNYYKSISTHLKYLILIPFLAFGPLKINNTDFYYCDEGTTISLEWPRGPDYFYLIYDLPQNSGYDEIIQSNYSQFYVSYSNIRFIFEVNPPTPSSTITIVTIDTRDITARLDYRVPNCTGSKSKLIFISSSLNRIV